ncbi:MAG: TerB family tellurite resistance protein [Polyangiaceae bacterium]
MLDALSRDERLLLIKFVCAYAWTDLKIHDGERRFVQRLVERLELDESDRKEVEHWLHVAPSPSDVDASLVPREHRRAFVEAVRAVLYADGSVEAEEREQLERLKAALER